ncbi:MAG: DUF4861 domain-containing protein [Sphingobacteriaceae bacterium]|nr:DUF4861 domain-containing protein [Sphingobacteriaceae bacterium]
MSSRFISPFLVLSFLVLSGTQSFSQSKSITLSNRSSLALKDRAISISRFSLAHADDGKFPLILTASGDTIPSQLDDVDGDMKWDELFFVVNLAPKAKLKLSLNWVNFVPEFSKRTSVRFGKRSSANSPVKPKVADTAYIDEMPKKIGYQPYQTDGPSWENDKVGFRHYFDGRNAKDLFGKRVSWMSPETVGLTVQGAVEDNYHVLLNWGRDVLPVGNSIGLGGIALLVKDSLARLGVTVNDTKNNVQSTSFHIYSEGPVRSVINFHYSDWKTQGRTYQVNETPKIWPGMYAYQNTVSFSGLKGDETLLVGLPDVANDKQLTEFTVGDWTVIYTHDKQSYNKEFWLGLALILPKKAYQGSFDAPLTGKLSTTYLAKLKVEEQKPVTYYAVGGWELADPGFINPEYFRSYVTSLTEQLSAKVKVKIN